MTETATLSRMTTIEIDPAKNDTWVPIGGKVDLSYSASATTPDTTNDDTDGAETHQVATRGEEYTVKCKRLEDYDTGARDPGQEAVEALGRQFGADSIGWFRVTSPGGNIERFDASAVVNHIPGGGQGDASDWEAKLKVSGASTPIPA